MGASSTSSGSWSRGDHGATLLGCVDVGPLGEATGLLFM